MTLPEATKIVIDALKRLQPQIVATASDHAILSTAIEVVDASLEIPIKPAPVEIVG
jgi:hypothetical protein